MMDKISTAYFEDRFNQLANLEQGATIDALRKEGISDFSRVGFPTKRNEEWRFTGISDLFKKEYQIPLDELKSGISSAELESVRLPGSENANEIFFINGRYAPEYSTIRSRKNELIILPLEEAAESKYKDLVKEHLGKSSNYIKDGIHALNTSFIHGGVFLYVHSNIVLEHPVYLYHISIAGENSVLSQPRSLVYVGRSAKLQIVESFKTFGAMDSFTNEVMEVLADENAIVEYYKFQNDGVQASQVGTTHIRQIGKSYAHTVVVTLDGGIVRNNTNIIMETEGNEAHMYGLYLVKGKTHVDNHTLVDNTKPNCFSNELYKGVMDDSTSGVFSGKIYVRPDAQKTNAYQTNNNILLSDLATVNTKPQLEIFADDVKCSHGCTVGRLDEEALFYLRTRGISKEQAQAMLLEAFGSSILEQIKIESLRKYAEELIRTRLNGQLK